MNKSFFFLGVLFCLHLSLQAQIPTANLKLWLRADSNVVLNGNNVVQWNDCSGNNSHAIQNIASNQPVIVYNSLNNLPVIKFDGINDHLPIPNITIASNKISVFIVAKNSSNSSGSGVLSFFNTSQINDYDNSNSLATLLIDNNNLIAFRNWSGAVYTPLNQIPALFSLLLNGFTMQTFYNSVYKTQVPNSGYFDINKAVIGSRYSSGQFNYHMNVDISEIIFFDTLLSENSRNIVEKYLMNKYAPPVNLGPDVFVNYGFCSIPVSLNGNYSNILWSNGSTTSTTQINKTGHYWVRGTDIFGRVSSDTIFVQFPANYSPDKNICLGDTILLDYNLTNGYSYLWSDGSSNSVLQVFDEGYYSIVITDTLNCQFFDTVFVDVDYFTLMISLGNDTSLCSGNSIQLLSGQDQAVSYLWSPGSETTPSIQVDTSGWYGVQVQNVNGCTGTDSLYVTIVGTAPVPAFQSGFLCFGDSTVFIDMSTPQADIAERTWIFNNTDTLFGQTVQYVFPDTGYHTVKLIVQDSVGCLASQTAGIEILPVPQANITHYPVCTNVPAQFQGNPVIPNGTNVLQQQWFIDGIPFDNQENLTWQFADTGAYDLLYSIILDNGCLASDNKTIQVSDSYPLPSVFGIFTPKNNIIIGDSILQIYWNKSENALFYKLVLSTDPQFNNIVVQYDSILTTNKLIHLPGNNKYYCKVIALNPCLDYLESNIVTFDCYIPNDNLNLKLWIRADKGVFLSNNKVAEWHDQSKNNYILYQTNTNKRPSFQETYLNNLPSVYFDGLDDWMKVNFTDTCLQPNTFILIAEIQNKGSDSYYFDGVNLDLRHVLYKYSNLNDFAIWAGSFGNFTMQQPYKPNLLTVIFNQNSSSILNNGQTIWSGNTGNLGLSGLYLGCSVIETWNFKGYISEILFYDSLLSLNDREKIQSYLMDKYSPPANLGPDVYVKYGFCPVKIGVMPGNNTVLWSTGSTADSIYVNQTGYYSVQVVDIFGRLSADTVYVQFPHFGFPDATVCLGDSIEYVSVMPGPYDYLWSDFSTDDHLFISQAGTYWLKLTDTLGCSFTDTFYVAVDSFSVQASLGPDMTVCSGESISLVSGSQPVDFLWSTSETSPAIVIQNDGDYAVTVTNVNGCTARDTISIIVKGIKPTAGFVADSACFGYPTSFTDTSSATAPDAISLWEWNVDGNIIAAQHPQFLFDEAGFHPVQLYVETDSGCTATIVQNVYVLPNPQPAFFPIKGCSGQPVQFTNQTTLSFGNLFGYEWTARDSLGVVIGVSAATHAIFTFPEPGKYFITLSAITLDGCRDSIVREVEIRRSPPVDFIWNNTCIGQVTSFSETTQVPPQEMIVDRFWNFGDNTTSVLTNPLHTYQNTGTYNVSLFNRSLNGCEYTATRQVSIHYLPVAGLDNSLPCLNKPVEFFSTSDVADGTIAGVLWTFPGGDTTSLWQPVYAFPDTGNFIVSIAATSNHDCVDSTKQTIKIYPYPEAAFSFTPEYGVPPLDVSFTNLSTGATSYLWNFGDNTFSTAVNPLHNYQETSVYSVLLIAINTFLCSDSTFGTVYVIPSSYDIAVTAAEQQVSGQMIQSSVRVKNMGNRIVRKLLMKYQIDFGPAVTEQWQGTLMPGQETWFTFGSMIEETNLAKRKVICYSAHPDEDVEDLNLQNNTLCKVIEPGFYIMSVAPNPASNQIVIHFVMKTDGVYHFEMNASDGRTVKEQSGLQGSAGINILEVDVSALQQGLYVISISDESDKEVRRVLIAR